MKNKKAEQNTMAKKNEKQAAYFFHDLLQPSQTDL